MTIHVDQLYYQFMDCTEHDKLVNSMLEFADAASKYHGRTSDLEKTILLWDIGITKNKAKVDVLILEFSFPDHSPSRVRYPILSTNGITALSLFLFYLKALGCTKLPFSELKS